MAYSNAAALFTTKILGDVSALLSLRDNAREANQV
jgi:hypothetical protein